MVDSPWAGRTLTPGQVRQRLETAGAVLLYATDFGSEMWKAPTGHHFAISLEDCDAEYLEGIIEQITQWAE